MNESFDLKLISPEGVDEAIDIAKRYRLLNDPAQAESICRDILKVRPDNQTTLIILLLSITDQFNAPRGSAGMKQAWEYQAMLNDEYDRCYYAGIICEREARALLGRGPASMFAYDGFRTAMDWFEKAEKIRPAGNDKAILRWNSCVRAIRDERLRPHIEEGELPLE